MSAEKVSTVLIVLLVVDDAVWQVMVNKFAKSFINTHTNTCSVHLFSHHAFPAAHFKLIRVYLEFFCISASCIWLHMRQQPQFCSSCTDGFRLI